MIQDPRGQSYDEARENDQERRITALETDLARLGRDTEPQPTEPQPTESVVARVAVYRLIQRVSDRLGSTEGLRAYTQVLLEGLMQL